jgi:hypothetical protein
MEDDETSPEGNNNVNDNSFETMISINPSRTSGRPIRNAQIPIRYRYDLGSIRPVAQQRIQRSQRDVNGLSDVQSRNTRQRTDHQDDQEQQPSDVIHVRIVNVVSTPTIDVDYIYNLAEGLTEHNVGSFDSVCNYCGAIFFEKERNTQNEYTTCCFRGMILIENLPKPTPLIESLLQYNHPKGSLFNKFILDSAGSNLINRHDKDSE